MMYGRSTFKSDIGIWMSKSLSRDNGYVWWLLK